jgi:hypothetical protein
MTILEHPALLFWFAAVVIGAGAPFVRAEPALVAASAKPVTSSAKLPATVVETTKTAKPTASKAKPRLRATPKSAKPAAAPAAKSDSAPAARSPTAAPARPNQVMDFDTEDVEGKRLEPGYELIQAGPRRARQPSLVPYPPKPGDSVVKRE